MKRVLAGCLMAWRLAAQTGGEFGEAPAGLRINQLQVLGTHNSYAQPVDPRVLRMVEPGLAKLMEGMAARMSPEQMARFQEEHPSGLTLDEALAYRHPDLTTQLEAGLRSLEIDVNGDREGGRFLRPVSYRLLREKGVTDLAPHDTAGLEKPGFKVLHIPDIDFRSHCPTLRGCLMQVRAWSEAHPGHVPLFLLLEAKSQALPILPGATALEPFDRAAFDALDAEILEVMGRDRVITPDDVRGGRATLDEAARAGAWPTLAAARGKVLFLMITAVGPAGTAAYLEGHPSLRGRVAFLSGQPGEAHAGFVMFDNALVRGAEIAAAVKAGYLVRTRADIETAEAKANDLTRARAAWASGAQVVSTDFFRPGNVYGTPYVVTLPGGGVARCNPVAGGGCGKR